MAVTNSDKMDRVIARALEDEAFKQELINNPKAVLAREAGMHISDNVELKVIEEAEGTFYFVLPKVKVSQITEEGKGEEEDKVARLLSRAATDETFKQELFNSPKAVIQRELGISIPEDTEVKVLEETDTQNYMVLPAHEATESEELSEEELESVAGGFLGALVKVTFSACPIVYRSIRYGVRGCLG